jgi:hypothetical protein
MRPSPEPPDPAFAYPGALHVRRHGPTGYSDDARYKDWLRDEFDYRCVYCLCREAWSPDDGYFSVEHSVAVSGAPPGPASYDSLLYSCCLCNGTRRDEPLPLDPCVGLAAHVRVEPDGVIHALTPEGRELIRLCALDRPGLTRYRRDMLARLAYLRSRDDGEARLIESRYLAYPEDLPDLSALRPPGGNTRPEGIEHSAFARRMRGELPATY